MMESVLQWFCFGKKGVAVMANDVFANGREIACKAGAGKTICAMPDVCFTPPENPATPPGVPVPYPNTGFSSDTTKGSKSVKISDKEIMLKNKSCFKKSTGDEAGCAAKKGVVTSTNKGEVYFKAWSMDVKVEGENVDRHLDLTTNNHACDPGDTPPWVFLDTGAIAPEDHPCKEHIDDAQSKCEKSKLTTEKTEKGNDKVVRDCSDAPGCKEAMACILVPKDRDNDMCCKPDNTGHHMIEDQWVKHNDEFPWYRSDRGSNKQSLKKTTPAIKTINDAPCVCANASRTVGTPHREMHDVQGYVVEQFQSGGSRCEPSKPSNGFTYGEGKRSAINAHQATFEPPCDKKCLESQLDSFYGDDNDRPLNLPETKQGLSDSRPIMEDAWGNTVSGQGSGLTQSLGNIFKKSGLA